MTELKEQAILLRRLQQAQEEDNLTLFVGAGVSKTVPGSHAKLWNDLVQEMQDILSTKETDQLRLAQMLFQQNPQKYYELTKNSIDSTGNISAVHALISKLAPRTVITTNWDCLLEKALDNPPNSLYDTITCDEELLQSQRDHKLIKMHGDFARGDGRFVFKEDDYLNYSHDYPLIETFVKSTLATTNVLFIGYSYSDINLKMIMTWLKQNRKHGGMPIHVIAQNTSNDIQIKYFLNWGIETFICNDASSPKLDSKEPGLASDDTNSSYKLFNFLNKLKQTDTAKKIDLENLWTAYSLYASLPVVPFQIITHFLPNSSIACNREGEPFLCLHFIPDRESKVHNQSQEGIFIQTLHAQLNQYVDAKRWQNENNKQKISVCIEKIVAFWKKTGIQDVSVNNFSALCSSEVLSIINRKERKKYYDDTDDITDYLDFTKDVFNESYDENEHRKIVSTLFKNRMYTECLIENQSLYICNQLKRFSETTGNNRQKLPYFVIKDAEEFIDVLPPRVRRKYRTLVDILTLKDISVKSNVLSRKIREKLELLNQRKTQGKVSFEFSPSFLERAELLNYLRFFWLNNLCIDYYIEAKEYVYLSLKYIFIQHYYSHLCCLVEQDQYHKALNDPSAIPLKRFEISAFLHYVNEKNAEELLDSQNYFLNGALRLALQSEDIDWLIAKVLPKLTSRAKGELTVLDGTAWKQRVGQVFKLLSVAENIETTSLKRILDFIQKEDFILDEPFLILPQIVVFFHVRTDVIQLANVSQQDFIESFLCKAINRLAEGFIRQTPIHVQSMSKVFEIANCFDPTVVHISDMTVDSFVNIYFSGNVNWYGRCVCIHALSWIVNAANDTKKEEIKNKIKECLQNDTSQEVLYEIFRVYLVHIGLIQLTSKLLNEISNNKSLRMKEGSWDSNTDWLISLLGQLKFIITDTRLKTQLQKTIQGLHQ